MKFDVGSKRRPRTHLAKQSQFSQAGRRSRHRRAKMCETNPIWAEGADTGATERAKRTQSASAERNRWGKSPPYQWAQLRQTNPIRLIPTGIGAGWEGLRSPRRCELRKTNPICWRCCERQVPYGKGVRTNLVCKSPRKNEANISTADCGKRTRFQEVSASRGGSIAQNEPNLQHPAGAGSPPCKTKRAPSKAGAIQQVQTCPAKG
jgi:hypothetical protein